MLFSSIIGQQAIKNYLLQSVQSGKIPHAQLLLGHEGNGALALAIAYAQLINCENRTETDSCGTCPSCIKANQLIHPDIHFTYPFITNPDVKKKGDDKPISADWSAMWRKTVAEMPYMNVFQWMQKLDADNKQANITAAECNEIIRKVSFKTFESPYKIFIVWMPEYLSKEGNKLLKLLEEPPENTVFLLVAEDDADILTTIISRTQLVKIPPLTEQDIESALIEKHGADVATAANIARMADGNFNAALELLSTEDFEFETLFKEWIDMLVYQKRLLWVGFAEQFQKLGREKQKYMLAFGVSFIRQVMLLKQLQIGSAMWTESEQKMAGMLAEKLNHKNMDKLIQIFNKMQGYIERNGNPKILCMNASIHAARVIHAPAEELILK